MAISIHARDTGAVLAQAEVGPELVKYEGNWYFDPAKVNQDALTVTARTYTCPYKGICNWVDYVTPDGKTVADVAWIYPQPKPGHEAIQGRYGFYAGTKGATKQEG